MSIDKTKCLICGELVTVYVNDENVPSVCENHCIQVNEDHNYQYDKYERGHFCTYCGKKQEFED